MQNLPWLLLAGAMGGLLAWLIAASTSGRIGSGWPIELAAGILGGAFAAGLGVYVLANTDASQLVKMLIFAAFCGLSWRAIIATGTDLVKDATTHKTIAKATEQLGEILAKSSSSTPEIQQLESNSSKVAENLPAVTDPELRKEAVETVAKAVDKLQSVAAERSEAVSALEEIGKRAAASGSTAVQMAAKESLQNISKNESAPEIATLC